jgi:putative FmdB family regulatory protein
MPLYTARCETCEHEQDYIRKIADRHDTPCCEECGGVMVQAIKGTFLPCMAISETMHIVSPIDGAILRSKSDYEAHMRKHNVRPASDFEGVKRDEGHNVSREAIREAATRAYDDLMPKKKAVTKPKKSKQKPK